MRNFGALILTAGLILLCIACVTILIESRHMAILKQQIGLYIYNQEYQSRHKKISAIAVILAILGSLDLIALIFINRVPVMTALFF